MGPRAAATPPPRLRCTGTPVEPRTMRILPSLIIALAAAGPALAQSNGNVANGFNYQPRPGAVTAKEQAAGIAPPPAVQQQKTGEVDDIYKTLMGKERQDGMTAAPANPQAPLSETSKPLR